MHVRRLNTEYKDQIPDAIALLANTKTSIWVWLPYIVGMTRLVVSFHGGKNKEHMLVRGRRFGQCLGMAHLTFLVHSLRKLATWALHPPSPLRALHFSSGHGRGPEGPASSSLSCVIHQSTTDDPPPRRFSNKRCLKRREYTRSLWNILEGVTTTEGGQTSRPHAKPRVRSTRVLEPSPSGSKYFNHEYLAQTIL